MKRSYIKYLTSMLLFGLNGIVAGNIALNSYEIVLFRTLIGSLFILAVFLIKREKFTFLKNKKDLLFIAISGVAMGMSWMFLYEGYNQTGVSIASLLYYTGPVFVMIVSPFLFKERLTATKIVGFIIVVSGIALINGNIFDGQTNLFGLFCGIMSAVTYCVMVTSNKKSKKITGMENSLIQLVVSFITVSLFVAFKSGFSFRVQSGDWVWIIILGVINTGIGCYLFFSSIGGLPVQTVAICGYIEPLAAVILSVVILNERLFPLQIVGAVFIIGGAVFGECVKTKSNKKGDAA